MWTADLNDIPAFVWIMSRMFVRGFVASAPTLLLRVIIVAEAQEVGHSSATWADGRGPEANSVARMGVDQWYVPATLLWDVCTVMYLGIVVYV